MKTDAATKVIKLISETINTVLLDNGPGIYRLPLIGYAGAKDPIFKELQKSIGRGYLLPCDLLPDAQSVMAFFLPYKQELVVGNREGNIASRHWAEAYDQTNKVIDQSCQKLNQVLSEQGIKSAWLLPTYEFNKKELLAQWSHKHTAYACGLGTFGRNQQLITPAGCAGRFGTMVLSIELPPSPRPSKIHSCHAENGCTYCSRHCPVQALSGDSFDRQKCYAHCLLNDQQFPDLNCVEVCGKCSTGPCGFEK